MEDLNELNELRGGAPALFGLPKNDPFTVPEHFFDRFPHEVQAAITARKPSAPFWSTWKRMAIALPTLLLLATASWWVLSEHGPSPGLAQVNVTPLTPAELDRYDDNDLLASTDENDLPDMSSVDLVLNDEELLAYLDTQHADLTELINDEE